MPPIAFFAADTGDNGASTSSLVLPALLRARPEDTLLAVIGSTLTTTTFTEPDGWTNLVHDFSGSSGGLHVSSHVVEEEDPSSHEWTLGGALDRVVGAILLYRGLNVGGTVRVESKVAVAASANFNAPAQTPGAITDLYMSVYFAKLGAGATFVHASTTARAYRANNSSISVGDYRPVTLTPTSTKLATASGAVNGFAASLLIEASGIPTPESFSSRSGRIGLPRVGA